MPRRVLASKLMDVVMHRGLRFAETRGGRHPSASAHDRVLNTATRAAATASGQRSCSDGRRRGWFLTRSGRGPARARQTVSSHTSRASTRATSFRLQETRVHEIRVGLMAQSANWPRCVPVCGSSMPRIVTLLAGPRAPAGKRAPRFDGPARCYQVARHPRPRAAREYWRRHRRPPSSRHALSRSARSRRSIESARIFSTELHR